MSKNDGKMNPEIGQKFLKLENGKVVKTTDEIYKAYWHYVNHQNYMEHLDNENVHNFTDDTFIENVCDNNVDVEQITETAQLITLLHESLAKLSDEEREIIDELFFNDSTMRKTAKKRGFHFKPYNGS